MIVKSGLSGSLVLVMRLGDESETHQTCLCVEFRIWKDLG